MKAPTLAALSLSASLFACVDDRKVTDENEVPADVVYLEPESTKWFLGTYDCPQFTYFNRPPLTKAHTTRGTLSFTEVTETEVAVSWREQFVSGNESEPIDFDGTLFISPPNANGVSGASLTVMHSDGSVGEGTGFSQGKPHECRTCIGTMQIHPFISNPSGSGMLFPVGQPPRLWSFTLFGQGGRDPEGNPNGISLSRSIESNPGSEVLVTYSSSFPFCTRRP